MTENWRDVVGYENHYEVSDLGNVRRKGSGHNLGGTITADGYVQYGLCVNNVSTSVLGHQIVAAAFLGPRPVGLYALHENDIKHENVLSNIRYGTPRENTHDAIRNGTLARGARHGMAKFTEQDIVDIRAWTGPQKDLVAKYGVPKSLISQIKLGRIWKHV